jgi:hypothetical protein
MSGRGKTREENPGSGFLGYDEAGHTSTPANRSGDIFAPVEMEVCAGAHRLVVMKEETSRNDARRAASRGLALVKLDFLIGTKWGPNAGRKQKCPSRSPNPQRNIPK